MTEKQRTYIREYYREYRKQHRAQCNANQRRHERERTNPERARRIEEAKAYYRAEFPPIDGVIVDKDKHRLEIYYSRGKHRFVTERWFEDAEPCVIHYTAVCDLMKDDL